MIAMFFGGKLGLLGRGSFYPSNTLDRTVDAYPLPHIDDILMLCQLPECFVTSDLASGYWQVRLMQLVTRMYGLFEFQVMPFGLCNAPSTFSYTLMMSLFTDKTLRSICRGWNKSSNGFTKRASSWNLQSASCWEPSSCTMVTWFQFKVWALTQWTLKLWGSGWYHWKWPMWEASLAWYSTTTDS